MSRRLWLLLGAVVAAPAGLTAQSPDWNAFLNVRPEPSPYIADWESDPSIVTLVLSYSGSGSQAFFLDGRILRGSAAIVGGRSTPFEFVRPTQLLLTTRDGIWDRNSVTYESALRDQIERTGRIPDGEYQFCVDVRAGIPESPGALLVQDCAPFSITAPQPPSLVAPPDGDTVVTARPTFVWTPVVLGPNAQVTYHVRVMALLPGQTTLDALANLPHFEADLATTALAYPTDALPLDDSARYVWQVQALDAAGLPVGERQGKSEVWTFVARTLPGVSVAALDSANQAEPAVGQFRWAGLDVKVLSLTDSSYENYSGVGRVKIVPGLFEPSFAFKHVRLEGDGRRVRFAPTHLIEVPASFGGAVEWVVKQLPPAFFINVRQIALVADSGAPQYAGINGLASLFVGFGLVDSLVDAGPLELAYKENCEEQTTAEQAAGMAQVCTSTLDWSSQQNTEAMKQAAKVGQGLVNRSLVFGFKRLGIAADGPRGTLRLVRDFKSGVFGLENAELTLLADSTVLHLAGGEGQLDLAGSFRMPPGVGLILEKPDTTWEDFAETKVKSVDSTVALRFNRGRVDSNGDLFVRVEGLPMSRVGKTGMAITSGDAWLDLSSTVSRGSDGGWRGVYLDSLRLFLPRRWHTPDLPPGDAAAPGNVQIVGYRIAIDGTGLSGEIIGSRLDRLGPVVFGGFSGRLDSLRLLFDHGNLEEGFVTGRLRPPFLDRDIGYGVGISPNGVEQAWANVGLGLRVLLPALGGELLIQRGAFFYDRPVGTIAIDGKLTIAREGVGLNSVSVYNLGISSEGRITLGSGWLALDQGHEARFNGFPVAVDSIGFGTDTTTNEVWLGVGGRFVINENLPASKGAFRLFAIRDGAGEAWRFSRFSVDRLEVQFENAAVNFRALVGYLQNDSIYGNVFAAGVQMSVQNQFSVTGTFIAGAAAAGFRYWYVDGRLLLPPPGIQLGPLPLAIWGFSGGAYSRMTATIDTNTLVAQYRPDSTNQFGLKAAVSIGTSANAGYIWNADLWLEAAVAASGGLQSLTLRGDHWMLTEVSQRYHRLWGTVLIDVPLSRPVLHANLVVNADVKPALLGRGWAELHFEPSRWYVNMGTPQRPDTLRWLPGSVDLTAESYLQLRPNNVAAGFAVHLHKEKRQGSFRGEINAGFEAAAELRYRPFQATGDGELWGDVSAEVKGPDKWYEIFKGELRATLAFRFPDPTGVWGRIRFKYRFANGAVKGTYRMRYSWGDAPDAGESDAEQFVLVAATYPITGDTAAPVTGMTYYLGMNEGAQYGMDDGVYRLRQTGTPQLLREVMTTTTIRDARSGRNVTRTVPTWQSIGTPVRDWLEDRATLLLKAPGHATLQPGSKYRALATFVLEKQGESGWTALETVNSQVEFRTTAYAPLLAQLVSETDPPGGATPLYFGGPDAGAVRVQFSNTHAALTSGAIRAVLVANEIDTVAGTWGLSGYPLAAVPRMPGDPTLYAFRPAGGALAPSTAYRFGLVGTDSSATEHFGVSFVTSRYATLLDHVNAATRTVTADRGAGPLSGTGSYLLGARITLAGPEAIAWTDIDSIDVVGLSNWTVTPRTRCQWAGGAAPLLAVAPAAVSKACGAPPTYENILEVEFAAPSDASLPPASTSTLTIRLNHRREGWRSFAFTLPSLATTAASSTMTTPMVDVPPPPPPPSKKKKP